MLICRRDTPPGHCAVSTACHDHGATEAWPGFAAGLAAVAYFVSLVRHPPDAGPRHRRCGSQVMSREIDVAIRGETGFHTFFWQCHVRAGEPGQETSP